MREEKERGMMGYFRFLFPRWKGREENGNKFSAKRDEWNSQIYFRKAWC